MKKPHTRVLSKVAGGFPSYLSVLLKCIQVPYPEIHWKKLKSTPVKNLSSMTLRK
jgi:hypothetical protein